MGDKVLCLDLGETLDKEHKSVIKGCMGRKLAKEIGTLTNGVVCNEGAVLEWTTL